MAQNSIFIKVALNSNYAATVLHSAYLVCNDSGDYYMTGGSDYRTAYTGCAVYAKINIFNVPDNLKSFQMTFTKPGMTAVSFSFSVSDLNTSTFTKLSDDFDLLSGTCEFLFDGQANECTNIPDGQATISLVGIDENGQHVAEKKTFNYTSGAVELDFSGILPQLAGGIYGYVIRAGKGFTAGTTTISEHWHSSFGSFDHVRNTYQISVTEGQQQGNIIVPHWVYAIDSWIALVPLPVFFTGRVTLSNSYAELPACMSSVTPDDDQDDTELILDGWIAEQPIEYPHEPVLPEPPDEPEPPTSPIPPDDPEYPYPPQPPTPPTPPAEGCACEIYIGLQIENLITALYDINSIRMQQQHAHVVYLGDHLQNINQNLFDLFQWISTKQNFDMNDLIDKLDEIKESIDDKHIPEPSVEINTSDCAPEVFVNKVYDDYEY